MRDLVPLKVKIVLGPDGKHQFPPFNSLAPELRGQLDWAQFVDRHGTGWHYDQLSGFGEVDDGQHELHANRDPRCWYGVVVVPQPFALESVARWPALVELIDEESLASFWDDRAHVNEPEELLDTEVLQGIRARVALEADPLAPTLDPSDAILEARQKCLDPECQTHRGIRKNLRRRWADWKRQSGITIHPDYAE